MANLFVKKSIAMLQTEAEETEVQALKTHGGVPLKRTLSVWSILALGVGAIIGAGIFVLTGHAAATRRSCHWSVIHSRRYSLRLRRPLLFRDGIDRTDLWQRLYVCIRYDGRTGWDIGWDLILEYALGATTVSIGWSGYVVSFLRDVGIDLPQPLVNSPFAYDAASGTWSGTGAL